MGVEGQEGAVAFSVISIEPERSTRQCGSSIRRPGMEEEEEARREGARAYEDENEMLSRQVNWDSLKTELIN